MVKGLNLHPVANGSTTSQTRRRASTVKGKELHTSDVKIEQRPVISEPHEREGETVTVEKVLDKDRAALLKFNEEPVTIMITPFSEDNPPTAVYCAVNGIHAECWINDRWRKAPGGYLPVSTVITVKRMFVEVLLRSKRTRIKTRIVDMQDGDRRNDIDRQTMASAPLSILRDENPRGMAWAAELMRQAA